MKPVDLALIDAAVNSHGFGEAEWEYRFHESRKWRFDLAWPRFLVAFEREGGTWQGSRHNSGKGFRDDCEKYNAAAVRGWLVIRATVDMIESGAALVDLLAALERRTAAKVIAAPRS